jgi:hypothetical protein
LFCVRGTCSPATGYPGYLIGKSLSRIVPNKAELVDDPNANELTPDEQQHLLTVWG